MKIYHGICLLTRACVSFPTCNHQALACVTHGQTHTHTCTRSIRTTYTRILRSTSLPHMCSSVHTYSSGLHTLSSVRSCKTEERSKRLLLPCCCPLQQRSTIADTGFPLYCSALAPRKAIPWFIARSRDFERPGHAPRSPAGTQTCAVAYRRAPCVPRSGEREKRPTGAVEKRANVENKSTLVHRNI